MLEKETTLFSQDRQTKAGFVARLLQAAGPAAVFASSSLFLPEPSPLLNLLPHFVHQADVNPVRVCRQALTHDVIYHLHTNSSIISIIMRAGSAGGPGSTRMRGPA